MVFIVSYTAGQAFVSSKQFFNASRDQTKDLHLKQSFKAFVLRSTKPPGFCGSAQQNETMPFSHSPKMSFQAAFTSPLPLQLIHSPSIRPCATPLPRTRPRHRANGVVMIFKNLWSDKSTPSKPLLNFEVGYSYLAHPERNTGEDAFFIEGNAVGVFDGVSGAFATRGVDPRLYSQALALLTRDKVREYGADAVVKAALDGSAQNNQIGASTVCVVGMDYFGRLFGINLGDSGVRIVRNGKMIFRTKEQQHFFNCPYQLGTDSEDGLAMGQNVQQKLKEGDWVIVATDGLYDNVSDSDIVAIASRAQDAMPLAEELGELASRRGVDKKFRSPFMEAALKANVAWEGGKADDVTVVALRAVTQDVPGESLMSTLPEAVEAEQAS